MIDLMSAGLKVILLSHVSSFTLRITFDKILKNQDIISNYGIKFLFIYSYFEDNPTTSCSRSFIEFMISQEYEPMLSVE